MRTTTTFLTVPAALIALLIFAIPAAAGPQCTDTGPNTTICQTPGHAQITTSPNPAFTNPYPGWGFGGIGIGLGGLWIGL
jgi:hypothetical protein